jgi:YidC/Oxa1 family membrane protein insertase
MNEQLRFFLAILACMGIVVVWQVVVVDPQAKNNPTVVAQPTETVVQPPVTSQGTVAAPTTVAAIAPVANIVKSEVGFETELLRGALVNEGPALSTAELKKYMERASGDKKLKLPVSLVAPKGEQAEIFWSGVKPTLTRTERDGKFIFVGQSPEGVDLQIEVSPRKDAYALDYVLIARNNTGKPAPVEAAVTLSLPSDAQAEGSFLAPPPDLLHGICKQAKDIERRLSKELVKSPFLASDGVEWIALDRQYFMLAVLPESKTGQCNMSVSDKSLLVTYQWQKASVASGAVWQQTFTLYVGPKRDQSLAQVSPGLREVIDYNIWGIPLGFLARPMVLILNFFHQWTASWGLAIVLLTLVVKGLLFPVTYKSVVSMRRMQLLKPEMDKLKIKYPNDRERQQMEQLKLFREKGVNPLGGCLPMLLQMPVWFALYRTLWTAVDLYQQPFLWLEDLTAAEHIPILALVLGGVTFLQQKLSPPPADAQQAKIMLYFMPVMLTVFMIALPSGLVLYILVNSVLTIAQQLAINKREVTL